MQKLQDSSPFPELPSFYEDRIMEAWQQGGSLQKERVWRVQTAREEGGGKHHLKARGRGKGIIMHQTMHNVNEGQSGLAALAHGSTFTSYT